uniref:Uncharacterized protein n=1 Tax=Lactuca sativa TaxID=4236 RepID=A0A9R1XD52_LACSA|nr:hypothetical protein LSAT_V11C500260210 [Lactuca sativa]
MDSASYHIVISVQTWSCHASHSPAMCLADSSHLTSSESLAHIVRFKCHVVTIMFHVVVVKEGVISCFDEEYLRRPNQDDLARLLCMGEERGFPGKLGSIDCIHWEWKICPTAWARQYASRSGKTTMHFSEHRVHAMILMYSIALLFLVML